MPWKTENWWIWLSLIFFALLILNMFSSTPKFDHREIIYSDFTRRVKAGEVINARIIGNKTVEGYLIDKTPYKTYVPPNHSGIVDLLRNNDIEIDYIPEPGTPWYISLLINWGPFLLIIGIWLFLMRRMQNPGGRFFSLGKSRAHRADPNKKKITFVDVAGVEESKEELVEIIEFLKDPSKFRKLGGRIPTGVLMIGPPGTGKTLLAKAVAGEADVPFFSISGSDFVEMFVGVGASRVRDLFEEGRKNAPCILFIDEIDAVGRHRGVGLGSGNDEREQTLNQLLVEMDGFDSSEGIIVIAATNRADVLDPALLRPGRFDRQVHVSLPDVRGREAILKIHAQKVILAEELDLSTIAKGTPGFSGADLRNLVNEAALLAARNNKSSLDLDDFEQSRDKIMMGTERRSMVMSEKKKKSTAYHEAGHALIAALLPNSDPIHKVTIVPRGRALGVTMFLPDNDNRAYDMEYLNNKITISMGGRAAEEIIFEEITTGASNDIKQATDTIRNMICRWGMSENLGPIVFDSDDQQYVLGRDIGKEREYGEETARKIDKEMQVMIKEHYQKAIKLLRDHLNVLHQVANTLIEEETIEGSRIHAMLGKPLEV